jgi:hypothetical protein
VNIGDGSGGPQSGDIRYAFLTVTAGSTIFPPGGWTVLYNQLATTTTLGVFSRPWASAQGTQNFGFTSTSDFVIEIVSVAAAAAGPQFTTNAGSGTGLTATGLTPTAAPELELVFFSAALGSGGIGATLSTPAGMTLAATHSPSTTNGVVGLLASRQLADTSATGNATSSASGSGEWRTALVTVPSAAAVTSTDAGAFLPFFGGGL